MLYDTSILRTKSTHVDTVKVRSDATVGTGIPTVGPGSSSSPGSSPLDARVQNSEETSIEFMPINGGFHSHGARPPIFSWFMMEKIHNQKDDFLGVAL